MAKKRKSKKRFKKKIYKNNYILARIRRLEKLTKPEFKQHDYELKGTTFDDTGLISQLTNIPAGTGASQRDGKTIHVKSIFMKLIFTMAASATDTTIRILLVLDRQTNQAIYTLADLIHNTTSQDNLVSPLNLDNGARFKIIIDKTFNLSDSQRANYFYKKYMRCSIPIRFDASTPSIADLTENSLSLVLLTNESSVTVPDVRGSIRLRFIDC